MIRYKHQEFPKDWVNLHSKLANYYERAREDLDLDEKQKYVDGTWQKLTLETTYHRFCQEPQKYSLTFFEDFILVFDKSKTFARKWAKMVLDAGCDIDDEKIKLSGQILVDGMKAYDEGNYEETIEILSPGSQAISGACPSEIEIYAQEFQSK